MALTLFAIIIGIAVFGMAVEAVICKGQTGRVSVSRKWYLILGLALIIPSISEPVHLIQELPNAQNVSLPLMLAFGFGLYLVIRFFTVRKRYAESGSREG